MSQVPYRLRHAARPLFHTNNLITRREKVKVNGNMEFQGILHFYGNFVQLILTSYRQYVYMLDIVKERNFGSAFGQVVTSKPLIKPFRCVAASRVFIE